MKGGKFINSTRGLVVNGLGRREPLEGFLNVVVERNDTRSGVRFGEYGIYG